MKLISALLAALAISGTAHAYSTASATATFRYTLTDLNPNDGTAPALIWTAGSDWTVRTNASSDGVIQYGQASSAVTPHATASASLPLTGPGGFSAQIDAAAYGTPEGMDPHSMASMASGSGGPNYGSVFFTLTPYTLAWFILDYDLHTFVSNPMGASGSSAFETAKADVYLETSVNPRFNVPNLATVRSYKTTNPEPCFNCGGPTPDYAGQIAVAFANDYPWAYGVSLNIGVGANVFSSMPAIDPPISPVPAPPAAVLLLTGLFALFGVKRFTPRPS